VIAATIGSPTRLIVLGAGTFAMDVADLISDLAEYVVDGFAVSVPPYEPGATLLDRPVYWIDQLPRFAATHRAVGAIVSTHRSQFTRQVEELGFRFATIVHPTARVSRRALVGEGSLISAGALITAHTTIGRHVVVNRGAIIGHHVLIGDHATIAPGANLAGAVRVGERAFVGMGAVVLEGRTIGERAIVGAGSVVTSDVAPRTKVIGAPARERAADVDGY
jgi:acetyltransferase EpsM